MIIKTLLCIECDNPKAPYRCPRCTARYCSVSCCQKHKARTCTVEGKPNMVEKDNKIVQKQSSEDTTAVADQEAFQVAKTLPTVDHHSIELSDHQKAKVRGSDILRSTMLSKRLREDFAVIDTAPNRLEALKKMRLKNPEFDDVIEKLVDVVNGTGDS